MPVFIEVLIGRSSWCASTQSTTASDTSSILCAQHVAPIRHASLDSWFHIHARYKIVRITKSLQQRTGSRFQCLSCLSVPSSLSSAVSTVVCLQCRIERFEPAAVVEGLAAFRRDRFPLPFSSHAQALASQPDRPAFIRIERRPHSVERDWHDRARIPVTAQLVFCANKTLLRSCWGGFSRSLCGLRIIHCLGVS